MVDGAMLPFLNLAGINHPDPSAPIHDHPIHWALETRCLHAVAGLLGADWFAVCFRPEKMARLTSGSYTPPPPTGYYNRRLTGKDIRRYRSSPLPTAPIRSPSPVWFLQDTLQYMNPAEIGSWFDTNPTLADLVCTTVIPPELCDSLPPAYPALYDFSVDGDFFTYIPEGKGSDAYVQPLAGCQWLTTSEIVTPAGLRLSVNLVESKFAHHVLVITRAPLLTEASRSFMSPGLIRVPWRYMPFTPAPARATTWSLWAKLDLYASRQRDTDCVDIFAKVSNEVVIVDRSTPLYLIPPAVAKASTDFLWKEFCRGRFFRALAGAGPRVFLFPLSPRSVVAGNLFSSRSERSGTEDPHPPHPSMVCLGVGPFLPLRQPCPPPPSPLLSPPRGAPSPLPGAVEQCSPPPRARHPFRAGPR
jgi:hypothetical protein